MDEWSAIKQMGNILEKVGEAILWITKAFANVQIFNKLIQIKMFHKTSNTEISIFSKTFFVCNKNKNGDNPTQIFTRKSYTRFTPSDVLNFWVLSIVGAAI